MTPSSNDQETKDALRDSLRTKLKGGASVEKAPKASAKAAAPKEAPEIPTVESGGGRSLLNKDIHIYFGAPGLAQMTAFCRQLATLVDVGIPLVQCLHTLSVRVEHPRLKKVVADVGRRVEEGSSLTDSLAAHPDIFSPLVISVIRIGEAGGILEGSLKYLAEIMERRYDIRRRVTGALAYPVAALIVCGLVILIILGFAMPVFKSVYADADVKLPGPTVLVLGLSTFVSHFWWLIILVVAGAAFAARHLVRSNPGIRRAWDLMKYRIPIVAPLVVKINVTRTSRTVSNLLHAGIPLLEALSITAETSENTLVAEMLRKTHDHIERGGRIDQPIRESGLFPDLVVDMIAIGDEAGRLDAMFDKVAQTYDADVDTSIRTLNAILEPALIVVMGAIVLFLALSILLPYWQLGKALDE
ncbi:type II secretion system F family protein [Candidatus Sumerlaeota bacterium]|nr:type II secretion system F family protein [Candidatus Sumerlaeota bacterium]